MLSVTRLYLVAAAIHFFGMDTVDHQPTKNVPPATLSKGDKAPLHQKLSSASLLLNADAEQCTCLPASNQDDHDIHVQLQPPRD